MVKYRVNDTDPADLPLGTYHVEEISFSRGAKAGTITRRVFQVRRKGEESYWHLVPASKLVQGFPPHLTARALDLPEPTKSQMGKYETHRVILSTAHDLSGKHATSHFQLKKSKKGSDHIWHWAPYKESLNGPRGSPKKLPKKKPAKRVPKKK